MRRSARPLRAVMLLTVLICSLLVGCSAATLVAGAATAMIGIVQSNEAVAPFFGLLGL